MLSLLKTRSDVEGAMDRYDLSHAVHPFVDCIDQLTNWYIRRSRRRFWSDVESQDREEAFQTLYTVLMDLVKIAAPYTPFIAETIYRNLRQEHDPISVHLTSFPRYMEEVRDLNLEEVMSLVQRAVSLGHGLRKEKQLKVRQPLAKAYIISPNPEHLKLFAQEKQLIADELNVQEVVFMQDEHQFVSLKAKPNFRLLGKKIGKLMKQAHAIIEGFSQDQLLQLMNGESISITIESEQVVLTSEDVQVEREVKADIVAANDGEVTVALDTHLTPELVSQGIAREIVNKVNTLRKEQNFDIADRIHLTLKTDVSVQSSVREHETFIKGEILALSVHFADCEGVEYDINGISTVVAIAKAF